MSDSKAPAIRARLRYANVAEFKAGYSKFVSTGGMFIPVPESKLKPVGSDIRFQFMLSNGETVLLGKGNVLQVRRPDPNAPNSPVGILVKFSKLSQDSKKIIDEIVAEKDNQKKVPTQEVVVEPEEVEERGNYPTPAALDVVGNDDDFSSDDDISEDKTVVGTLDDIFRSQSPATSLDEKTPTPEQIEERTTVAPVDLQFDADDLLFAPEPAAPEPDDLLFAPEPDDDLFAPETDDDIFGRETVAPEPAQIPVEKPKSNIRVLSYDDMSAVDTDKVDFGFSGEESEIDDMFDDLFGKSGDSSFFDDVLGGDHGEKKPEILTPISAEPVLPSDTEPELPAFIAPEEPIFEEDSEPFAEEPIFTADIEPEPEPVLLEPEPVLFEPEPVIVEPALRSPDDSLSMEDAFESEPEEDFFNENLNSDSDSEPFLEAPSDIERINEVYESEDENPFRQDPPSVEMDLELDVADPQENDDSEDATMALSADSFNAITANDKPQLPQLDDFGLEPESSVVEFDLEPEPSIAEFDLEPEVSEAAFESFDEPEKELAPTPAFEHDISRGGELDSLLGNLENDSPLDRSFSFDHDDEIVEPEELVEDSDSLEALLALANKDIKSKKEEEQEEVDILDQLLGDEDLPPLPDVSNSFQMPKPESSGKKKGLFSKLFGKE